MINLFPEAFLGTTALFILVCGSILGSSPKYNYPIFCFQYITILILLWTVLLIKSESCDLDLFNNSITYYFGYDNLGAMSKIFIVFGLLACNGISRTKKILPFEYYVLTLLALLGLCALVSSFDFLSFYLCLELQSLCFYILASFQRYSAFSTEAGLKYFLLGAISSSFLLFGISFVYGFSGTTNLEDLSLLFLNNQSSENTFIFTIIKIGLFFFSLGLIFKLGVVPFHIWLADVYEGAPTNVTAIFAILPKIAIFTVFIRLFKATSPYIWESLILTLGLGSLILGSLGALAQSKFKRLLAFSGISHVGYAFIALACASVESLQACLFYILIYIITSVFFWGLTLCIESKKKRTLYLSDILMWSKTNPYLAFTAVLVLFSLAGIPPLGGFFAKFAVFASSAEASIYLATLVGLLSSAIGILYYLRLVKVLTFEESAWYTSIPLKKIHVLSLGLSSFFLIFFVFFGDFFLYILYNISLSA
jgi:NADH-quinone oxidoreductase subunit N